MNHANAYFLQHKLLLLSLFMLFLTGCGNNIANPTAIHTNQATGITTEAATISNETNKTPLVVFGAGSLIIPFNHLEQAFEARYPNIDVKAEYHGSIQVIRHVSELHKSIDVVATADASLIPLLMYAVNNPETGKPYRR